MALQMYDFYITPVSLEVLSNQASMAMMWLVLAAKQAPAIQQFFVYILDMSCLHQV